MAISKVIATTTAAETYSPTPRRPQLIWNGRRRQREAEPMPAQTLEIVRPVRNAVVQHDTAAPGLWPGQSDAPQNRLIWTNDNLVALTSLLHGDDQHPPLAGQVDLIYIDPPFAVQSNFAFNVEIENGAADEKEPTLIEQLAYEDTWKDGLDSYLSMMRDRLELLKALLKPTGSIYVHCDWHAGHYLKVLMDEVFGYDLFVNEIVWKRTSAHNDPDRYGNNVDYILVYSSSPSRTWNPQYATLSREYQDSHYRLADNDGRRYRKDNFTAPDHGRSSNKYEWRGVYPPSGRMWAYTKDKMEEFERQGRIVYSKTGFPEYKRYLDEMPGVPIQTLWDDVFAVNPQAIERTGSPPRKCGGAWTK